MKNLIPFFILFSFLMACSRQVESLDQGNKGSGRIQRKTDIKPSQSSDEVNEVYDYKNVEIKDDFFDSIARPFSDRTKKDIFTFFVPKGNVNQTSSTLKISNSNGQLLFSLNFRTNELINGYALQEMQSDHEVQDYILELVSKVLHSESFINFNHLDKNSYLNQVRKEDFYDYTTLEEIKQDNRLIFVLSREEENILYFGYSQKKRRVVEIYGCC